VGTSRLFQKVYGLFAGFSIGDAMGGPVEGMHYKDIVEKYGTVETLLPYGERIIGGRLPYEVPRTYQHPRKIEFLQPQALGALSLAPGSLTDDTRYRLLIADAIVERGSKVKPEELYKYFVEYWIKRANLPDGPEKEWAKTVYSNLFPREDTYIVGLGGTWKYFTEPIGAINAGNCREAFLDGGIVATAVAAAMEPDATVESVIESIISNIAEPSYNFVGGKFVIEAIEKVLELADKYCDVFEIREPIYKELLVSYPPWDLVTPLEKIPVGLAMLKIAKGDPKLTIIGCVNFGRDCDGIAGFAGGIAGAINSITAFPIEWIETINKANPNINLKDEAYNLYQTMIKDLELSKKRSQILELDAEN